MDVSAIATVQTIVGDVIAVNHDGTSRALKTGDALFQGDTVKASFEANATITYHNGSSQTITENTYLVLTQPLPNDVIDTDVRSPLRSDEDGSSNALFNFYEADVVSIASMDSDSAGDGEVMLQTLTYSSIFSAGHSMINPALSAADGGDGTHGRGNDALTAEASAHASAIAINTNSSLSQGEILNASSLLPGGNNSPQQIVLQDVNTSDLGAAPDATSADVVSQLLTRYHVII